jgi:hypothetical protein
MDLCQSALKLAHDHAPQAALFMADLTALPIKDKSGKIDCVLLLDVLEHLKEQEALSLLSELNTELSRPLHVIVSMPIISLFSLPCIYEAVQIVKCGARPETGLFDRTHKILTNQNGHRRIFNDSGFEIIAEGYTSPQGIIGIDYPERQPLSMGRHRTGLQRLMVHRVIPALIGAFSSSNESQVLQAITAYQGLYLLAPKS